ncbi:MAG TPA: hypothetical protein VM688_04065 [Nocardioidaceae bacterium]|nr:hypothetical protein [Nocardioidaceae bacterium]
MFTPLKLGFGALVTAVAITAVPGSPATAKSMTIADARNTPAAVDVTSVTYRNGESTAGGTIRVRDLRRSGTVVLRIGPPDSDVMYYVTAWIRSDSTVGKRLEYVTDVSRSRRSCAFSVTWSSSQDFINVSVPHSCLNFGRFLTREWFQATMHVGSSSDAAPGREVGRGSSPGCASSAEMSSIATGYTRGRVASILDTDGRFGDGGAGGYSRVYPNCGGGRGWFVEYNGDTTRVVGKGRVRA